MQLARLVGQALLSSDYRDVDRFFEHLFSSPTELARAFVPPSSDALDVDGLGFVYSVLLKAPSAIHDTVLASILTATLDPRRIRRVGFMAGCVSITHALPAASGRLCACDLS